MRFFLPCRWFVVRSGAALIAWFCVVGFSSPALAGPIVTFDCDVVVAEASLGGVAAALQALRLGSKVCMSSMTDWVGGQLTNQAVPIDESNQWTQADRQFLARYAHKSNGSWVVAGQGSVSAGIYSGHPHTDEVERSMAPLLDQVRNQMTPCWVSSHCFSPAAGNQALRKILAPWERSGQLVLLLEAVPKKVEMVGSRIRAVEFIQRSYTHSGAEPYAVRLSTEIEDWYARADSIRFQKTRVRFRGPVFIDATETGELLVMSGARYRLGFEGTATEPPETECVMGFDVPVNLLSRPPTLAEVIKTGPVGDPPGGLDFDISDNGKYNFWPNDPYSSQVKLPSVFNYRRIASEPEGVTSLNWGKGNDYTSRNLIVPPHELKRQLKDWKGGIRPDVLAEAEARSLSFVAWLNLQAQVSGHGRGVTPEFDLHSPKNLFGTGTGLAKFPYLRESRRMEGFGGFYIQPDQVTSGSSDLGTFPDAQYSNFTDSVGIGSYPMDTRRCPTGRDIQNRTDRSNHYQIPLRALVSANVDNLLVANKTLAVTQIVNAAYRLHPTEWNAGFASGTAASVGLRHQLDMHQVVSSPQIVEEIQREIVRAGGRVIWFSDQIPADQL